jgi:hypothetical protein
MKQNNNSTIEKVVSIIIPEQPDASADNVVKSSSILNLKNSKQKIRMAHEFFRRNLFLLKTAQSTSARPPAFGNSELMIREDAIFMKNVNYEYFLARVAVPRRKLGRCTYHQNTTRLLIKASFFYLRSCTLHNHQTNNNKKQSSS